MNISSTEILIVLVVALIVLGPQRLPDAMKTAGKAYREFRKVSGTVQREINEVVNETTGMFTSTADVISGKSPTDKNGAATNPANASYRPADEMPADEMPADEVLAHELPADERPDEELPAEDVPPTGTNGAAATAGGLAAPDSSPDAADRVADEVSVGQAAEPSDSPADVADEPTA